MRAAAPPRVPQLCRRRPRVRHAATEGVEQPVPCDRSDALALLTELVGEARRLEEVERRVRPVPGLEVQPGCLEQGPRQHDDGVRTRFGGHLVEELAAERVVAGADAGQRLDRGEYQLRVAPELPVRGERRPCAGEVLVSLRSLRRLRAARARERES